MRIKYKKEKRIPFWRRRYRIHFEVLNKHLVELLEDSFAGGFIILLGFAELIPLIATSFEVTKHGYGPFLIYFIGIELLTGGAIIGGIFADGAKAN